MASDAQHQCTCTHTSACEQHQRLNNALVLVLFLTKTLAILILMAATATTFNVGVVPQPFVIPHKKKTSWSNLFVGAGMNIFQVATLGQPMENMKTYVCRPQVIDHNSVHCLPNFRFLRIGMQLYVKLHVQSGLEDRSRAFIKASFHGYPFTRACI
jgi:hypothetical protein